MNTSLLNKILNREHLKNDILNFIKDFYSNPNDLSKYRGLYLYGEPGIGKTMFIKNILHEYDIIYYDAGSIRNKSVIIDKPRSDKKGPVINNAGIKIIIQ